MQSLCMQLPRYHASNTLQIQADHLAALGIAKSLQNTLPDKGLEQSVHDVKA